MFSVLILAGGALAAAEPLFPYGRNFDTTYLESFYPARYSRPGRSDYGLPGAEKLRSMQHSAHPRTYFSGEEILRLKQLRKSDPEVEKWISGLLRAQYGVMKRKPDGDFGRPIDLVSLAQRIGFAYRMTGDPAFADYGWILFEKAVKHPNYRIPGNAFCYEAHSLGVLYDMFSDGWNRTRTDEFLRFAKPYLDMGVKIVRDSMGLGAPGTGRTNIGLQTQGSYLVLASALFDRYPEECSEIIAESLYHFASGLEELFPDGGWREGPGYWGYSFTRGIMPVLITLQNTWGTMFRLETMPGLRESAFFLPYVTGSVRNLAFAFGDSREQMGYSHMEICFIRLFGDRKLVWLLQKMKQNSTWSGLLSRTNSLPVGISPEMLRCSEQDQPPLGHRFRRIELGSFRSSWTDPNGWFLAFKGGWGAEAHGNLHAGTFVLDAMGERWITSGAGTSYDAEDCWNYSPLGGRWRLFGARAESKNCLVVNLNFLHQHQTFPFDTRRNYPFPDQAPFSLSELVRFDLRNAGKTPGGIGVLDLTPAYRDFCNDVKRGFRFDGHSVEVQDEVRFRRRAFYDAWFLMTVYRDTGIEISRDGTSAILKRNGKQLHVSLVCDMPGSRFVELPMRPLPKSESVLALPKDWSRFKRLAVHLVNPDLTARDGFRLRVSFRTQPEKEAPLTPIADWK